MASGEGFAGGVQMGLQMFNAMQNASYMQSLQQAQRDNLAMRQQEAAFQEKKFAFEQDQKDFTLHRMVMEHPDAFSAPVRLQSANWMNSKLSGGTARPMDPSALDAFEADLRNFPDKLAGSNDRQEQLTMVAEMSSKAHQHPLLLEAFKNRAPVFQQVMEQQGWYDTAKATWGELMDDKKTRDWVRRTDPKIIAKTFEDKDFQKAFVMRHVENNLAEFMSGERRFSDAALRDTMAQARSLGMDIGPKAENLLKTHDTYTMHNRSAETLRKAQQDMDPLFKQIRVSKDAKAILEIPSEKMDPQRHLAARNQKQEPLGPLSYFAADLEAAETADTQHQQFLQNNPQIAQSLEQLVPDALSKVMEGEKKLADLKTKRALFDRDKAHPNRDMYINLYDREKETIEREMLPYKELAAYGQNPGIPALQKVLRLEKTVGKAYQDVDGLRQEALTASERVSTQEATRKWEDANITKSTNWTLMKLNQYAAANPGASEEELRGKEAEFAQEAERTYGMLPDSNKVMDTFVTKRTQQTLLSGENLKTVADADTNVAVADSLLTDFDPKYFGSVDNLMNKWRAKLPEGMPGELPLEVQEYRQRVELYRTQYRKRIFGASLTETEKADAVGSMVNLDMGDTQAKAALKEMKKWEQKAIESLKRNAGVREQKKPGTDPYIQGGPQPQEQISKAPVDEGKSFDAYQKWRRANPKANPNEFLKGQ